MYKTIFINRAPFGLPLSGDAFLKAPISAPGCGRQDAYKTDATIRSFTPFLLHLGQVQKLLR